MMARAIGSTGARHQHILAIVIPRCLRNHPSRYRAARRCDRPTAVKCMTRLKAEPTHILHTRAPLRARVGRSGLRTGTDGDRMCQGRRNRREAGDGSCTIAHVSRVGPTDQAGEPQITCMQQWFCDQVRGVFPSHDVRRSAPGRMWTAGHDARCAMQ